MIDGDSFFPSPREQKHNMIMRHKIYNRLFIPNVEIFPLHNTECIIIPYTANHAHHRTMWPIIVLCKKKICKLKIHRIVIGLPNTTKRAHRRKIYTLHYKRLTMQNALIIPGCKACTANNVLLYTRTVQNKTTLVSIYMNVTRVVKFVK